MLRRMISKLIGAAALAAMLVGCVSYHTTGLALSGTAGAAFTATYKTATLEGTVKSSVAEGGSSQILEVSGESFQCEITKADPNANLVAEVVQGHKAVFRAEAPAGTRGVRISVRNGRWQGEPIP